MNASFKIRLHNSDIKKLDIGVKKSEFSQA